MNNNFIYMRMGKNTQRTVKWQWHGRPCESCWQWSIGRW